MIGLYEWLGNPTTFEPPGPFGNMNPYMATKGILLDITVSQINNKIKRYNKHRILTRSDKKMAMNKDGYFNHHQQFT